MQSLNQGGLAAKKPVREVSLEKFVSVILIKKE